MNDLGGDRDFEVAAEAAWASWCLNLQPSLSSHGGFLTKILQLQHKCLVSAPRPRDWQLECLALGGNGLRVPAVDFDAGVGGGNLALST